jgi:hypothetical protein
VKVNYRRTVEKQRQESYDKRQKERQKMLESMSEEEREAFLEDEKKRVRDSLSLLGSISSYLGDNPYSKL